MAKPYTITKHDPDSYVHDKLFIQDRQHNALNVNTGRISGSHVIEVSDDPSELDDALVAGATAILGRQFPYARDALVRRVLRPASDGAGRDRWR